MKIKFPSNLETHTLLIDIANHILFDNDPPELLEIVEKAILVSPFERKPEEKTEDEPAREEQKEIQPERSEEEPVSRIQEKRNRKGEG